MARGCPAPGADGRRGRRGELMRMAPRAVAAAGVAPAVWRLRHPGGSVAHVVTVPLARLAQHRRRHAIVGALMLAKSGTRPGAPAKGAR